MSKRKYDITYLTTKYGCKITNAVIKSLGIYFRVFDIDRGTNRYKIFIDVFFNCDKSYKDIAKENCISESTLRRYLNQYIWLAEQLLKLNLNSAYYS